MSEVPVSTFSDPADLPPGTAPTFGEAEPHSLWMGSPVILSALAERRESRDHRALLSGTFAMDDIPATGILKILASAVPGVVHIDADIAFDLGGTIHYEADVRETWVTRTTNSGDNGPATIVRALADIANLPRQSTVKVHFQA